MGGLENNPPFEDISLLFMYISAYALRNKCLFLLLIFIISFFAKRILLSGLSFFL